MLISNAWWFLRRRFPPGRAARSKSQQAFVAVFRGMLLKVVLGMALLLLAVVFVHEYLRYRTEIAEIPQTVLADKKNLLRQKVSTALEFIEFERQVHRQRVETELAARTQEATRVAQAVYQAHRQQPLPQIAERVRRILANMPCPDFGPGYFFAINAQGKVMLHTAQPALEGQALRAFQNPESVAFLQRMIVIGSQQGEGYLRYRWPKPPELRESRPKLSHVRYFEPLDWIIGTGVYLGDIRRQLMSQVKPYLQDARFATDEGYLFGLTMAGQGLFNRVYPEYVGQNMLALRDPEGFAFIQALLEASQAEQGGFVRYVWDKPGQDRPVAKIAHARRVPSWDWVLGATLALDPIDQAIATQQARLRRELVGHSASLLGVIVLTSWLIWLLTNRTGRRIRGELLHLTHGIESNDPQHHGLQPRHYRTLEFAQLAAGVQQAFTDEQAAEAALRASEAKHRRIIENLRGVYYHVDRYDRLVFLTPSGAQLLGYDDVDELLGRQPADFFVEPARYAEIRDVLYAPDGSCEVAGYELFLRHRHGHIVTVLLSAACHYDEQGRFNGHEGILADVSELKQLEARLRRSLEQTERMNRLMQGREQRLIALKQEINGLCQALGRPPAYRLDDEAAPEAEAVTGGALEPEAIEQTSSSASLRKIEKQSLERSINCIVSQEPDREALLQALHEARRNLLSIAEDAVLADAAKSAFVANMSHDIRTPLNAIIGMGHLLTQTPLTKQQQDYVNTLQNSASHLLTLINDILDFSKIEADHLEFNNQPFALETIRQHLAQLFAPAAQEKGLELIIHIDPNVPVQLVGDAFRLEQVLNNLISNAVKFTDQGEISLKIALRERTQAHAKLIFHVQDTGIGLTAEQQTRVFDAFTQADSATNRNFSGTGLGLAISQRLVAMMDGELTVHSEPGIGSTFSFTAAFAIPATPRQRQLLPPTNIKGINAMVVDNHRLARETTCQILTSFAVQTTPAANADECVKALQTAPAGYRLLVVDWRIAGMEDFALLRRIQALGLSSLPKVVLLTNFKTDTLLSQSRLAGVDAFLTKPITASAMFNVLLELFAPEQQTLTETSAAPATPESGYARVQAIRGATILLVEDRPINRDVAIGFLEQAGLQVQTAADGRQALALVKQQHFDAVLMDIQMPVMDGLAAAEAIRRLGETPDYPQLATLPILAMTAHAMRGDRERSLAAGMNDHITKPIDPDELYGKLAEWVTAKSLPIAADPAAAAAESKAPSATALPILEGIDTTSGLRHVGHKQTFYRQMLIQFANQHCQDAAEIQAGIAAADWAGVEHYAHALKSVAATLGAHDLQTAAAELEHALHNDEPADIEALAARLTEALATVCNTLQPLQQPARETGQPADGATLAPAHTEDTALKALLEQLAEGIRKRQPRPCNERLAELKGYSWPTRCSETMNKLEDALANYQFDQALRQLDHLKTVLIKES